MCIRDRSKVKVVAGPNIDKKVEACVDGQQCLCLVWYNIEVSLLFVDHLKVFVTYAKRPVL